MTLTVGVVLVAHERSTCLNLRLQNCIPEFLRGNRLAGTALTLITLKQLLKFGAVGLMQIRSFIGREERPVSVGLDTLHAAANISKDLKPIGVCAHKRLGIQSA